MDLPVFKEQFLIRGGITYLNFGSFGACPLPVFETYQKFQLEIEREAVEFFIEKAPIYLKKARISLGQYLNCSADDVVCVTNPTYAVNIVAKNFKLQAGDEILSTNLEYGACSKTWDYYCKKAGAKFIQTPIRFPLQSKEDFIEQFTKGITPNTKLIFISHLTSVTALRLPVEEICNLAKERGILTFIDGAHAPAQVEVDLANLNCDLYTGACHKWMLAPKGSSFLYATKSCQSWLDPLVVSWGYESATPSQSQFLDYHEMQGTRDLSAFCSIPAAIEFMNAHNWIDVRTCSKNLVRKNAATFSKILGSNPLAPLDDNFIAQMFSAEINISNPELLHDLLLNQFKIEIPVMLENGRWFIRYSINAFNSQEDLNTLFYALEQIKR